MAETLNYRRLMLKVSGEALAGEAGYGVHATPTTQLAEAVADAHGVGLQVAVVVGGGNIFRGKREFGPNLPRATADQMGMLATMINSLALREALAARGVEAVVLTALECPRIAQVFHWRDACSHLDAGRVVICAGGTGNPYFTTDTTAALRACEIEADLLVKATQVDGVYNKDPREHGDASRYDTLTLSRALEENLQVMDSTAFALCMDNDVPILVCNIFGEHSLLEILKDPSLGTLVTTQ